MSPYLKIIQHGATWVGTVVTNGNCNPVFNEQALIRFKMLKEKIKFELWHEEEKIGETTMYAFEMLGERQTKSVEMTRNQTVVATLSFVCQSCLPHILSELS